MREHFSDIISENKKEGMKGIAKAVYAIIACNDGVTYSYICENILINTKSKSTLNRRVYDVLNVMRAVRLVAKRNTKWYLTTEQESINRKREELSKLQDMKRVLTYIIYKNKNTDNSNIDKLYLPFMIIKTDQNAVIHCDTNEERTFFKFKSSSNIELVEDLEILKELYLNDTSMDVKYMQEKDMVNNIFF